MKALYLCNGKMEECNKRNCYYRGAGECKHTADIRYAKHFKSVNETIFIEEGDTYAKNKTE